MIIFFFFLLLVGFVLFYFAFFRVDDGVIDGSDCSGVIAF